MAARDAHNRQAMLNRVRDFWVKGVLESSLHEEARIELGLEVQRDAVAERPWDVILRTPDRPDCKLPPGTKISDVFERVGRSLLILGEPGAGKTTTLLELARKMIDRAEKDPSEKIPVVFNLSSWTDPKMTLSDWLTEELRAKYNIPKKISASWVENDSLLLLLDGLDEIASVRRAECVEAINGFLDEHLVPMVVCCRKEEYEALDAKLKLQNAILLQPLTPEQIDGYLKRLSPDLNALRDALKDDRELQEFAKTPLILSIMTLAYRGISIESLQSIGSMEERRGHLFRTYVDQMFERTTRIDPKLYPKEETISWLTWLARRMSEYSQTVFLIERMQPSLLETKDQLRAYSLLSGLSVGLVLGLPFGLSASLVFGLIGGLSVGVVFGIILGLTFRMGEVKIKPAEVLNWSWEKGFFWIIVYFTVGMGFWLIFEDLYFLTVALIGGPIAGLIRGLRLKDMETRATPNQGIKQSEKYAVIVVLIIGLIGGVIGGLIGGLIGQLIIGLIGGMGFGLCVGLIVGLAFGGLAVIQHLSLRFVLHRENLLPWNLVSFLDYATERIILRKVGGGYVFVHRMLMDYFASLEPGPGSK